jgi:hypothetical protein
MLKLFIASLIFMALNCSLASARICSAPGSLLSYRNFSSGGFEFVEFKFKKSAKPKFVVSAVSPPFSDTGDRVIPVAGALFTQITFMDGRSNSDSMTDTESYCSFRRSVVTPKPVIIDVKLVDDFEDTPVFVIGRRAGSHYYSTKSISAGAYQLVRVKFRR